MIIKYLCNIVPFYHRFGLVSYLLTELTYLLALIPLPVYNYVRFTKITGSAVAAASDIHRQLPTHMADIRRDWLTNQNTD